MAYNNYFPGYYPQYQPYQNQGQSMQMGQSMQIQSGGFVSVRSMEEAFNYPIAPGNSITFKDENAPYVYTKTKGFSPLEQPIFEKYRLVKEEDETPQSVAKTAQDAPNYDEQIKALWDQINAIKAQITAPATASRRKKEVEHEPDE